MNSPQQQGDRRDRVGPAGTWQEAGVTGAPRAETDSLISDHNCLKNRQLQVTQMTPAVFFEMHSLLSICEQPLPL